LALNCNEAFGRYLRMLRERRSLSLDDVESLSRGFPEPINKGYLSRCENGRQRPAFSKVVALARIYEVPSEVLVERMELDLELDRVGAPETQGRSFAELYELGKESVRRSSFWEAYAYVRDASFVAASEPVRPSFRDKTEQSLIALMNVASAAMGLGKAKLACYELEHVHSADGVSRRLSYIVLERLAKAYRDLSQFDSARRLSDLAIQEAEKSGSREYLGYMYANRARLAEVEEDPLLASDLYLKAFKFNREAGFEHDCARDLLNLASAYVALDRYRSARRALTAADRIARKLRMSRTLGFVHELMGNVEAHDNDQTRAAARWREAARIGKQCNDRFLRFRAELRLLDQALTLGNRSASRAITRRLRRLSPWIPEGTKELVEFKRLQAAGEHRPN
jgi:tetratricopeptide (TPR) repeat protein